MREYGTLPTLALLLGLGVALPALGDGHGQSGAAVGGLLELSAKRLGGPVEPLSLYRGQVLLVVNTASRCGYTPQYEGLQALYERYRERGFSVLGFPSNDFGNQEPGGDVQIGDFCRANYGVEFPMFSKVRVKGEGADPVYRYLTSLPAPIGGPVKWNFEKYLVDREGRVVARFASRVTPEAPELVGRIEELLEQPRPAGRSAGVR